MSSAVERRPVVGTGRNAAGARTVEPASGTVAGRRAGIVTRLAANTVDAVGVVVAIASGYAMLSAALFMWSPSSFRFPDPSRGVLLAVAAAVTFVYLTVSWASTGRTYGDHLLGLRVVNFRGQRMRLSGAAARAALSVVFPIGVMWVLVSPANRSVQDVLLRTSVVYDWDAVPVAGSSTGTA